MIEIKGLCKSYGNRILFDDFNLTIDDSDYICISGDSGVGKTTLLNMIGQIESYDGGEILFDGKGIVTKKDKLRLFRERIGFVFQNFLLVDDKTVEENLNFIRNSDRTTDDIVSVLAMLGLDDKKHSKIYTLSGGEQQRVAMARLYLKKCQYILADEPTGSLDSKNADRIMEIFEDLNKKGKTIIIVTHDEQLKNRVPKRVNLNDLAKKA